MPATDATRPAGDRPGYEILNPLIRGRRLIIDSGGKSGNMLAAVVSPDWAACLRRKTRDFQKERV
jgi:hypothetical protein